MWSESVMMTALVFLPQLTSITRPASFASWISLLIGALFMATDYVTTPTTFWGQIIFGIGCGVITFAIRVFGSYPEGVSFSILIMNLLVWYIDRFTMPVRFGGKNVEKKK